MGMQKSTVIAGYVGDDKAWASVDAQWRGYSTPTALKSFHMADAIAQRGEFHQIQSYMVKDICNALANIRILLSCMSFGLVLTRLYGMQPPTRNSGWPPKAIRFMLP